MSEKEKTILIVILAFVVMFGCLVISCCAASLFMISRADRDSVSKIMNESIALSNNSLEQNDNNSNNFLASEEADHTELSRVEQMVIDETEKVRGLTAQTPLAPVYQTTEDLRNYMIAQLEDVSDEDMNKDLKLYAILGFAPENFDLRQFYVDMYSEQIAGFYDPDENQMYLIEDDSAYNNAVTLAHEYTHYLQYNNPDFSEYLVHDDDFCEENGETCIILDALIEGDAMLTESRVNVENLIGSYNDNSGQASSDDSSIYDSAPKFFQDSLLFPYMYGYDFVSYHYLKGGFDHVNDLFKNLPQSVEQIMHPEKYLKDEPVEVNVDPFHAQISEKFDIIKEDVLNESDVMMILSSGYQEDWQLSDRQAASAAEGWGGGTYIFAENEDKPLFFSKTVWDSERDAEEAETVFSLYCDKRFSKTDIPSLWTGEDNSKVYLIRQDDILYWMILPDNFNSDNFVELIRNGSAL